MDKPEMDKLEQEYFEELVELQPPGAALPRDLDAVWPRLLMGVADGHAAVERRGNDLLREADPRSTFELLPDFEREYGLPDACSPAAVTLQERRDAVVAKMRDEGRHDLAYWYELAAALGYEIEIDEPRPFIAGVSCCGDCLNGGHEVRFEWDVTVKGPRVTLFRCGESTPPDSLGDIAYAEDLECRIRAAAHSHTRIFFDYEDDNEGVSL
ncbi:conserved hypothetical protein [uncultured delta proteobacterium]|uniref:Tail protein n=1 Tax=uncultured delta proteobacterium TaxID=34034 RepID=A0A212JEW9_9DELT|nr:conserved hypothetical protein [uncultured delta proteobacterium]SBW04666.1 conserved hypothetical protein [uncultured delta proteobacterium]